MEPAFARDVKAVMSISVALIVILVGFVACTFEACSTEWGGFTDAERIAHLERVAADSGPLINAIRRFESAEGRAPGSLEALVPAYISGLPSEWARLDDRLYFVHPDGSWHLAVYLEAFSGDIDCDVFVYFPSGCTAGRPVAGWCWCASL